MKRKKEDIIDKLVDCISKIFERDESLYINYLFSKLQYLEEKEKLLLREKPIFFKKAILKWKEDLKDIQDSITEINEKLNCEIKIIDKLNKPLKDSKK